MIRIELVEDGLPAAVLYANIDAIEEAMLREREAFEWALAREAMSPFSGFQSRLMDKLRRVVERRPKLCAALAVAGAAGLGYWLWTSGTPAAEDEVPENARCPICMDRAVSAHKGAAFEVTFAAELCCVCGATTCAPCAEGVLTRGGRGPRPDLRHVPDAPYSHGRCAASAIAPPRREAADGATRRAPRGNQCHAIDATRR